MLKVEGEGKERENAKRRKEAKSRQDTMMAHAKRREDNRGNGR